MVRITKVYTKQGDLGQTSLAGGQRIAKASNRICAYGTVDELNAVIGMAVAMMVGSDFKDLKAALVRIQNELFNLGSQLAVLPEDRRENTPLITKNNIIQLEDEIDHYNQDLPPLKSFILPGGGPLASQLHVARTVCRRAEREVLFLAAEEKLDGTEVPYLNRLSDWFFVASRYVAAKLEIKETLWEPQN